VVCGSVRAGKKSLERLLINQPFPIHKPTRKQPMAYAKDLMRVGQRTLDEHHEVSQRNRQEGQRPADRCGVQGRQQRMEMPGALEEHGIGGALSLLAETLHNRAATLCQQRQ
jgi:hypothetical protein